jgi:carboxyl-terminal processing protease
VYPDTPAERARIEVGDVITEVEGKSIAGVSSEVATSQIKGPAGTEVSLQVRPTAGGPPRELTVERADVRIPAVDRSGLRNVDGRRVAYVHFSTFSDGAHGELRDAIERLYREGAEGLVLDLRGNGGGLLNEAVLVSSIFVGDGTIVSTKGRARPRRVFEATGNAIDSDVPVVVLVNRQSASASEIVTGALQDRNRAEVIGTRTFGKGVFQEIRRLSNGGALDITVGEYYTPKGRNLGGGGVEQGMGIRPDIKAEDDAGTEKRDEALEVALETVARQGT